MEYNPVKRLKCRGRKRLFGYFNKRVTAKLGIISDAEKIIVLFLYHCIIIWGVNDENSGNFYKIAVLLIHNLQLLSG